MAGEVCIRPRYCFIFSLILVHILLPSTLSDEPDKPCDSSNDGVYLRDTNDCAVAYVCSVAKGGWLKLTCPDDKWFDLNVKYCSDKSMVQCTEECLDNPCIQNGICTKIPKGYKCAYPNNNNNNNINTIGDAQLLISLHVEKKIYSFNEQKGRFTKLPFDGDGKPNAMRYEPTTNTLYIALEDPNQIVGADLFKNTSKILRSDVWCEGIEVDVEANLLFYTDWNLETINSMTLTGEKHKQLIKRGLRYPRSIVADKSNSVLYWIDITQERIESADYDGNNKKTINFHQYNFPPRALDIMQYDDNIKLYFCDERDEIWEWSSTTEMFRSVYQPKPSEAHLQCDSIGVAAGYIYTVYYLSNNIYKWDISGKLLENYNGTDYLTTGVYKSIHPISIVFQP